MNPIDRFRNSITIKLVSLAGGISVLILVISMIVTTFIVRDRVMSNTADSLKSYNDLLYTLVENSFNQHSQHLEQRSTATLEECGRIYQTAPAAADARINAYLLSLKQKEIFAWAFDSKGIIKVHPDRKLINTSVEKEAFIQKILTEKKGTLAYQWKPVENESVLSLISSIVYFKPLDLHICLTDRQDSVLSQALSRVMAGEDSSNLKTIISGLKISTHGYPYIINSSAILIAHPDRAGDDISEYSYIRHFIESKEGVYSYKLDGKNIIAVYREFAPLGWIIASGSHYDDFIGSSFRVILLATVLIILFGSAAIFILIHRITSVLVTAPVIKVKKLADAIMRKDFSVTIESVSNDEIGLMTDSVGKMITALKTIITAMAGKIDRLSETSTIMEEISNKMSTMSQDQASAMEETSAALEETQASMEQITGRTETQYNNVDKNAHKMSQMAEEAKNSYDESLKVAGFMSTTAREASNGEQGLNRMVDEMQNIKESTSKIAEIIEIISDISEQVNLLSLNAAIEAARAGDHGRGFAVVADEISKLADQTASSAKTIAALVQEGNSRVDSGTEIVNRTARTFHQIIESIEGVTTTMSRFSETLKLLSESSSEARGRTDGIKQIANEVSVAAREQMATTKDISRTIEQVNESSQELVAFADSILKTAEEIGSISRLLKDQLGDIKF